MDNTYLKSQGTAKTYFEGENISNRHLSLTWASIGFNLGINF